MKKGLAYLGISFLFIILATSIFPSIKLSNAATYTKSVSYTTDGTFVYVAQPNFFVQIRLPMIAGQSGGEITAIMYKGSSNIVSNDPQFGQLIVYNPETKMKMNLYIGSTSLISAVGNNTGQLILTFASSEARSENGQSLPISTLIQYVFYADIDDIFVRVEFNSGQKTWLFASSTYGASLNLIPFESYNVTGYEYGNYGSGILTGRGQTVFANSVRFNILTLKKTSANLAITLFPTSIFLNLGTINDNVGSSKIGLAYNQARTWDGYWIDYGSYFTGGIVYSCAWALSSDGNPFIVTPWIMPNSTPYGVYWTLDDLPAARGYYAIPPDPSATDMNNLSTWLENGIGTTRRVTILWSYDQIAYWTYPTIQRNSEGLDQSWNFHGSVRVASMPVENRNYYASIYGKQVGYGTHAYHHDYPWMWEFGKVTNVTWIDATWNQIYLDAQAFLGNMTLNTFKAAGYGIQPVGLNVITKYGIRQYEVAADRNQAPLYTFFVDDAGNRLVETIDVNTASDDVTGGKTAQQVADDVIANITTFGLSSMAGHFLKNSDGQTTFNNAFDQIESYFGDSLDYFLTTELNDYWINVLWNNNYSFNTTTITSSSKDTRLTYMVLNRPQSFSLDNGLSCSVAKPNFHELYSPNLDTKGWKFTRITGYATVSKVEGSQNSLAFTITKPLNTVSSVKIFLPQGEPNSIGGADSFSYDSDTHILTIHTRKNTATSTITINYQSTTPIIPQQEQVASPTFSLASGAYSSTQSVSISCATSGATIRYTTDNSEPTSSSNVAFSTISVSTNLTIKAKAFKTGMLDSNTVPAAYIISTQSASSSSSSSSSSFSSLSVKNKVETPTFTPMSGIYDEVQLVTIQCATVGATIRYTTNGEEPTSSSSVYHYPVAVAGNITLRAKAFKTGLTDSATASAIYNVQSPVDVVPPTLSVSLNTQDLVFRVTSNDNANGSGIANVTLYIDGNAVQTWNTEGTSSYPISSYPEGNHTYFLEAFDNADNKARDPVTGTKEAEISQTTNQPKELSVLLALVSLITLCMGTGFMVAKRRKNG